MPARIRHIAQGCLLMALAVCPALAWAQRPIIPLGEGPWEYDTFEQGRRIEVSVVSRELSHPWSLVFLPGSATTDNPMGNALITENPGRVRLLKDGQLLPEPVAELAALELEQLFDIVLHPDFATNGWVFFSYMKTAAPPDGSDYWAAAAVARGRFDGQRLLELEEIFVADTWNANRGGHAIPLSFAPDGTLLMASSHRLEPDLPQDLGSPIGKILRLAADGSLPADNPFRGREGARPELFSYGHRTVMGLEVHPESGEIWELENGPQGGDELNILKAGANYGWPLVTHGREYDGRRAGQMLGASGMEAPELFWVPSITVSSLAFYSGERFPEWRGNLFVSAMTEGRIPGTGHLQRIVFNENGELRRERLLSELRQRIRFIGQGLDGLLYALTDENDGVLLRIAPAPPRVAPALSSSTAAQTEAPWFSAFDCAACHQLEQRSIGPSYRDIARRYDASESTVARLAEKIIEGGEGEWGEVPMAAHAGIELEQARAMARRILDLGAGP